LADAFVTASLTEVHPLSLIEALTAGLPALGIASPGIEDTIIDGANGFLCPNDIAAFTGKLTRLMLDDELRRRFAAGAAASAAQYDVRITAAALLACYERVIEARLRQPARPDLGQQLRDLLT
ncbi:MAG: glycosyltransferase, partial [Chloroflexi bacterium]|nr:glycosyltransferase [Chloroflexota bacterium]